MVEDEQILITTLRCKTTNVVLALSGNKHFLEDIIWYKSNALHIAPSLEK